jgi:tetratricopeptide (TPR) repeat protein
MTHVQRIRLPLIAAIVILAGLPGCGGGRPRPASPQSTPSQATGAAQSVQQLFEEGRHAEVVRRVDSGMGDARAAWFAGQSHMRLGEPAAAAQAFERAAVAGGTPAWQAAADLAVALLRGDGPAIDRAMEASVAFPDAPLVQFERGLVFAMRDDFARAAEAFDLSAAADPMFAYAYYRAGLAYRRLDRADLMVERLATFQRLAPRAPETAAVAEMLRTFD